MKEEKNISEDLVNIQSAEINGQNENNNNDNESEEKAKTENRARNFQNLILTNNKFKEVMLMLNDEKKEKENFGVKDNNDNNKKKALTIDAQIENLKKTKFSFISSKLVIYVLRQVSLKRCLRRKENPAFLNYDNKHNIILYLSILMSKFSIPFDTICYYFNFPLLGI